MLRQIKYEWLKLTSNKFFVSCFILLFLANIIIFGVELYQKKEIYIKDFDYIASIESKYKDLSSEKMFEEVERETNLINDINLVQSFLRDHDYSFVESMLGDKMDVIKQLNERSQEQLDIEKEPYNILFDAMKYSHNFNKNLEKMEESYSLMNQFSIFSKKDTFNYRNIEKTRNDYSKLIDAGSQYNYRKGVVLFSKSKVTDLICILLVMLVSSTIFWQEREKKLWGLIHSNKKGRATVTKAKLSLYFLVTFGIVTMMYSMILLISSKIVGLGDLTANIQSISEFSKCSIPITVFEYLLLFFIFKTLAIFVIAMVLSAIFSSINNYNLAIGTFFSIFIISYIFYNKISILSSWNKLKFLNIFAITDTKYLLGDYVNLDFFKYAVNVKVAGLFFGALVFLLCLSITIYKLSQARFIQSKTLQFPRFIASMKKTIIPPINRIFIYELYKLFIVKKLIFVIASVAFLSYYTRIKVEPVYNLDEFVYLEYIKTLEGELTEEKEAIILEEKAKFDNLYREYNLLSQQYEKGEISKDEYDYNIYNLDSFKKKLPGFNKIYWQYEYLLKLNSSNKGFVNQISADYYFDNNERDVLEFTIFYIAVMLIFSWVFTMEYKNNAIHLIRSTKFGRNKLFWNKIIVCLAGVLMSIPIYIRRLLDMNKFYPMKTWEYSLNSIQQFRFVTENITILNYMIIRYIIIFYITVTIMFVTIFISLKLRKIIDTIIIMCVFTIAPIFIDLVGVKWLKFGTIMNGLYCNELFSSKKGIIILFGNLVLVTIILLLSFKNSYKIFVGTKRTIKKKGDML